LPASRAFTFLANGSSPWMNLNNYSRLLPWGMPGVGLEKAADIYMRSHQDYPPGDAYSELRDSMYVAALIEAGGVINHDWVKAVANAYAGINVGDVFQGTPIDVQQVDEIDVPNDTIAQAQGLGLGSPPPAGAVLPAPHKLRVMGGGNDNDFYTARLRGDVINVLVTPTFNSPADHQPYALIIWELTPAPVIRGIAFPSLDPQLVTAVFPSVKDRSILITVVPGSGTTVNSTYQLDIDLDQNVP
jgi:hypothetical protein